MRIRVSLQKDDWLSGGWVAAIKREGGGYVEVYAPDKADAMRLAIAAHREVMHALRVARRTKLN